MGRMKTSTILAAILSLSAPFSCALKPNKSHLQLISRLPRSSLLASLLWKRSSSMQQPRRLMNIDTLTLASFKSLLKELPAEPLLIKFASEAALQSGDTAFALSHTDR